MLSVVLVMNYSLNVAEAGLEQAVRCLTFRSSAVGIAAPGEIGPRQIFGLFDQDDSQWRAGLLEPNESHDGE